MFGCARRGGRGRGNGGIMRKRNLSKVTGQSMWARLSAAVLCLLLMAGLFGCGSKATYESDRVESMSPSMDYVKDEVMDGGLSSSGTVTPKVQDVNRKLIKTVEMTVETKEYDRMSEGLKGQVAAYGGYVERMNTYNGSSYSGRQVNRSASLTIRIPEDKLDAFLSEVSSIGNVIRRSENVTDVTLAYVDLTSHRDSLQTEHARLLELLEKAETVADIITIQERLSNVRYQIESMESQIRTYDNQVDYSTIYLEINEVKELTPVEEETVWERISGGFVSSLRAVGSGFVEFFIWLLANSPYLIIWALVIFVALWIVIRWRRKHNGNKTARKTIQNEEQKTDPKNDQGEL